MRTMKTEGLVRGARMERIYMISEPWKTVPERMAMTTRTKRNKSNESLQS
jgi:hypothetical protein